MSRMPIGLSKFNRPGVARIYNSKKKKNVFLVEKSKQCKIGSWRRSKKNHSATLIT